MGLMLVVTSAGLAAQEVDNASARAFNSAAALQNAGLHVRASQKWTEFIAQFPQDPRIDQAHYFLGICVLREKKFEEAIKTFQTVLSRWPQIEQADKAQYNLAMAQYELAAVAGKPEAYQPASQAFQLVVAKYPNSEFVDEALYYQGDCLFTGGKIVEAVAAYQQLIAKHPDSSLAPRAYYDLGIAQQELEQFEAAAKTFQAFRAKPDYAAHPLAAEIRLREAICLNELEQFEEAAKQFDEASKQDDFALADYAALRSGQTLLEHEQFDGAAKYLNAFPQRFPESTYRQTAIKTAGQSYFLADQPAEAVRVLTPLANSNPADAPDAIVEAAYWLGRAQLQLKQPEAALGTLDKAIAQFGNHSFVSFPQFARIDALYAMPQRRAETPALYAAFLDAHPDHPLADQAAYMAAVSAFGQQDYGQARKFAEAFLAKPGSEAAATAADLQFIAAESYLLESPDDAAARSKAESLYRDLIAKYPEHTRAARSHLRIGWCLEASDKAQDAINYLRETLAKFEKTQQLPEAQLIIGRCHATLAQHREAVAAFDAASAANGNWERIDEVWLAAAQSHRELNEPDPAVAKLTRLANEKRDSPSRPQALYWLGEIAQQREQVDAAISWFQQLAEQYASPEPNAGSPFRGPATHAVAAMLLSKQQYPQSRQWAERLINAPANEELKQRGHYLRGVGFHREGNFKQAINDFNTYRTKPQDEAEAANAAYLLVLCHVHEQQFAPAQAVLNELLQADPNFAAADQAYYELGHGLRALKDRGKEAAAAFQWIADNRPESPLAAESWLRVGQYQLAVARESSDEAQRTAFQAAEAAVSKGLEKQPEDELRENMLYFLGDLQYQQQRYAEATATLQQQVAAFPNGSFAGLATFLAAQSHYRLGQYDKALPLFVAVAAHPLPNTPESEVAEYHAQALYRAGDSAAQLKRWQESQQHFQKLFTEHPQFSQRAEAQYGIAFALQQQNQLDQAIAVYEQVTEATESETAAKARFMIGEIEFGRKKYEPAIEQFLTVTVGYAYEPWQALARFETARCFLELGDSARAARTLREMIEKHPQHARTSDAKKMLNDLKQ